MASASRGQLLQLPGVGHSPRQHHAVTVASCRSQRDRLSFEFAKHDLVECLAAACPHELTTCGEMDAAQSASNRKWASVDVQRVALSLAS